MVKKYGLIFLCIILPALILTAGCGGGVVKSGDTVKVHYTGTLADGTQFDSSAGREPLEFTVGSGKIIAGFDEAVVGMKEGETKTITIPADKAYGQYNEKLVFEVGKDKLPASLTPEVGMQLQMNQEDGNIIPVTIIEVAEKTIKIDANHPMAGKDLTFNIELVGIGASEPDQTGLHMTLEEATTNGKPTLAEFGSDTCVPCKQMKPILEDLAFIYENKVNVIIIDVYERNELARQFEILAVPTQVFFDSSGKEVARHVGYYSKEDIAAQLKEMGIE